MKTPNTSLWMLRRLAARALRVHERQAPTHPAVASYDGIIPTTATTYMELYGKLRHLTKLRMQERREGKEAISELVHKLRLWAPRVDRDVEEVRTGEYGENPSVPDDVLRDARSLLEHVADYTNRQGQGLDYVDSLKADLEPTLAEAEAEWGEAGTAQRGYADLRKKMLETGIELEQALVAYRRTLRAHVGRTDPDYQKLRIERLRSQDEDDDAFAAALPEGIDEDTADGTEPSSPANEPDGEEAESA